MITNLYFVRHAHSIYTPDELERPLSDRGKEDAFSITEKLMQENIDYVISSPYKRAIQTVDGIARYIGLNIVINEDFKERTLSLLPVGDFNKAITKVWSNPDFTFDGGESNKKAQQRGVKATMQVLDEYKGKNVVIGTHGNLMVLIMNYFDKKYDFHFWEKLAMPDIYRLSFYENQLIEVRRIDENNTNSLNTGYTIYRPIEINNEEKK
ncbi:histidine phosphatase family protein [Psychrobacillus sp. FJAT-51614]|uniref:Histidine phosphatase family protein n=1 Tax=Psychrobacillus mangrovi TaxID=3117745 RepID=A0ABU8EZL0_9BACI